MSNDPQIAVNPTAAVQELGQSLWYDNIRRGLIDSGELQALIDEYNVVGVTSNPSILQKAIGESSDYDDAIEHMLDLDAYEIYETLAIQDIQRALDLLLPVYERTNKRDGYVSLEVSPLLAQDTEKTVSEARRLFKALDRPNAMIKIPATQAGIPAIEQAIAEGINVNVTLIFAIQNYSQAAEAYIRGLEKRLEAGLDVSHVASVASFFLSRIDTLIDRMLENNIRSARGRDLGRMATNRKLLGKAAIANAKLAYRRFLQVFHGERFAKLRAAGAQVQRPLWASTGTKNPAYPDTLYVDSLIGKDTVNTVPPGTLKAFYDHGTAAPTLQKDLSAAEEVMDLLAEVNIDIDQVTQQLQDDGVDLFIESFESLLNQVSAKCTILRTGVIAQQKMALGIYAEAVQRAIKKLDDALVNRRIWAHDATVWKDYGPAMARIGQSLGWLDVSRTISIERLKTFQESIRSVGFKHAVMVGMGGSSAVVEALNQAFGKQAGFPEMLLLNSTDPGYIRQVRNQIDPQKTLFIISSRSGQTIETRALHRYCYALANENGSQFIAITSVGSELDKLAQEQGFRNVFHNPPDMNSIYSALGYTGMVPAAIMGLDLDRYWSEAERMIHACGENIPGAQHPGIWLGAVLGALSQQGRDKISIHASSSIATFARWAEFLIAEGTGKDGKGLIPITGATPGKPHDYATDRVFIYLKAESDADTTEMDTQVRTLREAGHPRVTLLLKDPYSLAGEFFRWQYAVSIAAKLLEVDPFDIGSMQERQQRTTAILDSYAQTGVLPPQEPVVTEASTRLYADEGTLSPLRELCAQHGYDSSSLVELLAAQIVGTMAGDYFGILAYLPPTPAVDAALNEFRRRLRHVTRRAVVVNYGPGYLHGPGQLYRSGQNTGVFFQITADHPEDLPVPGEPYTFSTLVDTQAASDLETLRHRRRRALRLHISGDVIEGIGLLLKAVDYAEARRQ